MQSRTFGGSPETSAQVRIPVTGLIRIHASKVMPLLAISGYFGIFLEAVAHHPAYPGAVVDWHRRELGEDWGGLRLRLIEHRAHYGLVLGDRQLGLRKPPGSAQAVRTLWQIAGTPVSWSDDFLIQALIQARTPADKPEVIRRLVRGPRCAWWVRATVAGDLDAHNLVVEGSGVSHSYWMLPSTSQAWRTHPSGGCIFPVSAAFPAS